MALEAIMIADKNPYGLDLSAAYVEIERIDYSTNHGYLEISLKIYKDINADQPLITKIIKWKPPIDKLKKLRDAIEAACYEHLKTLGIFDSIKETAITKDQIIFNGGLE